MNRREAMVTLLGSLSVPQMQQQQYAPRGRRPVVPQQVIDEFHLLPTEGYGFWVMGEDGKPYSLDDVLLVLFQIVRQHWGGDQEPQANKKSRSRY